MQNNKIVITGAPGTGKTSIIKNLENNGNICLHEVSREITAEAQRRGIEQLFLEQPLLFSEKLLEARVKQHIKASHIQNQIVFIDRGIPDIIAYMDYFGTDYPVRFQTACSDYRYEKVFLLPPWEEIYETDTERYESFPQSQEIHRFLKRTYTSNGYTPIDVPLTSVENRSDFILQNIYA